MSIYIHNFRINFCAKCRVTPYHLGKTCEQYKQYIHRIPCRFCDEELKNGDNKELQVCKNEECQNKLKICCNKKLPCGHYCIGLKDDTECIECHNEECVNEDDINDNDYCSICYVESLHACPCIKLTCGHIFHYTCIIDRIIKKCKRERINFSCIECPTCRKLIDHPLLKDVMKDELKLLDILQVLK